MDLHLICHNVVTFWFRHFGNLKLILKDRGTTRKPLSVTPFALGVGLWRAVSQREGQPAALQVGHPTSRYLERISAMCISGQVDSFLRTQNIDVYRDGSVGHVDGNGQPRRVEGCLGASIVELLGTEDAEVRFTWAPKWPACLSDQGDGGQCQCALCAHVEKRQDVYEGDKNRVGQTLRQRMDKVLGRGGRDCPDFRDAGETGCSLVAFWVLKEQALQQPRATSVHVLAENQSRQYEVEGCETLLGDHVAISQCNWLSC